MVVQEETIIIMVVLLPEVPVEAHIAVALPVLPLLPHLILPVEVVVLDVLLAAEVVHEVPVDGDSEVYVEQCKN